MSELVRIVLSLFQYYLRMGEEIPEGVLPPAKDKALPVPSNKNPTAERVGTEENVETKDKAAENIKIENGGQQEEKDKAALVGTAKVKEEPTEESQEKKSEAKPAQTLNATPKGTKEAKSIPTPPVSNRPRRQVRKQDKQDAENSNSK